MERNLQAADSADSPPYAKRRTQFGFKELAPGRNPNIDIVAIHGIDGDRDYSWTADNGVLWLRDLLPTEIPNARILTYGYDANTHGQDRLATDFMHEHAMNFVSKLALLRENSGTVNLPIIFVAHSSGGLLLKSALIHSHLCNDNHLRNHRAISLSTHGIAFFGTPHLGSATAELARSILDTRSLSMPTSTVLLRHLERDSEALQHQLMQYSAISGQFETKFFYEIYDTHFAGVMKRIAPRTSAVVPGAVNAEAIGIHKDHVNMVKFPSVEDEDFRTVSSSLSLMSKAACQKMVEREDRQKSTIKFSSSVPLESGVRTVTNNVEKVGLNIKTVTGDMAKIGQDIHHLVRAALPRADEARFDMGNRRRCMKGTRVELLNTVFNWALQNNSADPETSPIFWLCGQAGTGKTTISSSIADCCDKEGRLGASFFFSRDREDRSKMQLVFPTIASQLGTFCKEFAWLITEIFNNDPDLVHSDPPYQLEKLVVNPLKNCASFPFGTIIIIDALDECKDNEPITTLLSILYSNLDRLPQLRFFITSRPEENIQLGFEPLHDVTKSFILHNIEASTVDADIGHYLRTELAIASSIFRRKVGKDWPPAEKIESLVQKSSGLFIFAATAVRFILDRNIRDPKNQLEILLNGSQEVKSKSSPFYYLDQLYLKVLRQAFPDETPSNRFDHLKTIIGAIVLLRNPLSPGDLGGLLGLDDFEIRDTLSCLHSIITVPETDEQPIRLIHPSFFDFATGRCPDPRFHIDSTSHHEQLATFCFRQMKSLTRDICQIKDASKLNKEILDLPKRIEQHIPPTLQYACHHWVFHMCGATESPSLQTSLVDFCHEKLLYWIEALSLIGPESLRDGLRHIRALQIHVTTHPSFPDKTLVILKDALAFITEHFDWISPASLQLYRSALPLSSSSNSLRTVFSHELSGGVRVLQRAQEGTYSGVTVLRGHSADVISAKFSSDDTLVVSACDDEVRLWDKGTGTLLKILEIDNITSPVYFVQDRDRIISVLGPRNSICIWDTTGGTCLRTTELERGHKAIFHFTCSSDVTRIAGSAYSEVMIWDISNGSLLNTLRGHEKEVRSIAFSPSHMLITSASDDCTIRIWDSASGAALNTLTGHSRSVTAISFSPCSKYLASGSEDRELRLWDISCGVTLKIFTGHSDSVYSVAFSQDGMQIISGSWNDVRVWNVDGVSVKTLRLGEFGVVENVGFSFDGSHYICTSGDAIYIWNADHTSDLDESEKQLQIRYIKFSPDGTLLIATTPDELHLLDGLTGDLLMILEDYFDHIDHVEFSPNNQYLAFIGMLTIRLWEISSPTAPTTLHGHSGHFHYVAFSSDSTQIVSSSYDGTLRIWDTSGNNIFTVEAYHRSAEFSPDRSQIIADGHYHYDIPPHIRSDPIPLNNPVAGQLRYSMEDEWVLASRGNEKERCIWLPADWRKCKAVSSRGRVAIGTRYALVLLDLSDINLSL